MVVAQRCQSVTIRNILSICLTISNLYQTVFTKVSVISPQDLRVTSCDGRMVQLEWTNEKSNLHHHHYAIEYNTSFEPDQWHLLKDHIPAESSYQRIALSPWGNYSFRIKAVNNNDVSEPSLSTREICSTPPDVPHMNPRNVCTINLRPHTLAITWQLMHSREHNAPGFHYLIRWRRHDITPLLEYEERIIDSQTNSLIIDNQPVYKPYEIYVLAVNSWGEAVSPPRMVIGHSSEDVPLEIPREFKLDPLKPITATTADFIWESVNPGPWRMQGFFKGYKIQFWKTTEGTSTLREHLIIYREPASCWQTNRRQRRDVNSGHVYNMWPYTNVTAHILALNAKYDGAPSSAITFRTAEGAPSPVRNLKITEFGADYVSITWEQPLETNGILTGYNLAYRKIMHDKYKSYVPEHVRHVAVEDAYSSAYNIYGLEANQLYHMTMSASTRAGTSEPLTLEFKTLSVRESPPNFTAVRVNKRAVNVTWFPAASAVPGVAASVHYRKLGQSFWTVSLEESNKGWLLIEGLEPGVSYEMRVVLKNTGQTTKVESSSEVKTIKIENKKDSKIPSFVALPLKSGEIRIHLSEFDLQASTFYVQFRSTGTTSWQKTSKAPVTDWITLSGLYPDEQYEVKVIVCTVTEEISSAAMVLLAEPDPSAQASVGVQHNSSCVRQSTTCCLIILSLYTLLTNTRHHISS